MVFPRNGNGLAMAYAAPLVFALTLATVSTHRPATSPQARMDSKTTNIPVRVVIPPALDEIARGLEGVRTTGAQHECLAKTVYFEARGETLKGQLAVAQVVMNRTRSDLFPSSACNVMVQKSQFSFVHEGRTPAVERNTPAWRRAVAVSRMVLTGRSRHVGGNALFFHATSVSPKWGRPLFARIGAHIFYL